MSATTQSMRIVRLCIPNRSAQAHPAGCLAAEEEGVYSEMPISDRTAPDGMLHIQVVHTGLGLYLSLCCFP